MRAAWVLGLALPAVARAGGLELGPHGVASASPPSLMALLALLSLLPFAVVMLTCFAKLAVVLSFARSALGTQGAPPTLVLTGLAAVLTGHVMAPVVERTVAAGQRAAPQLERGGALLPALVEVAAPLRAFLLRHGSAEERARFAQLARELRPPDEAERVGEEDLAVAVPAFVLTEMKEAFQIGFLVFLPFLVLDMVVANVLLALGMQNLSPGQVSLPFKVLLFVAVDGWALLAQGLVLGYR